jgi:arginyl-tRNA synthetase
MILPTHRQVHAAIAQAIRSTYGVRDVPPFTVETPPNRALGDLAVTVAFQLARTLRKAPRAIAQELAAAVGPLPGVARIVAAPNG